MTERPNSSPLRAKNRRDHILSARVCLLVFGFFNNGVFALAQSTSFSGFSPGNLVVSRSVYTGTASTVAVNQALPPVCPASAETAKKGQCAGKATDNGAYPSTTSTSNVWNNNKADGSFGITSPIFLDQITPTGTPINTLAIPSNMLTTSFSSKSELAVNLSVDGTALTFIGYVAPPNTLDVSNSNTPGVYDPTNPAGGSYYRAVAQVGANGAIQVTPTNAYSGNNGRAAILANGLYYLAGNDNNGTGTPANIVSSTGVEIATPGQAASTAPTQVGTFSITQLIDPTTGKPYAPDKAGKDNNFRGLTIFNNTLFITKGSGGNGVDTVYQVGTAGSLPTLANAASTLITILPGFPTALASTAGPMSIYPFGIWFANATTLYVADEGDGVIADAATAPKAGLQKWSLINGTWQLDYVLQSGLNLGQPYSVPNYPASLNPATDGLRNLTGRLNSDGTVTLWAVTSTVSANGDQGADPNQLVMITDVLANTTAAGAANEQFITIKSAAAGEVLRGVSLTPTLPLIPMQNSPSIVSLANPGATAIAAGSLAAADGQGLAGLPGPIFGILPTAFGGTSVTIVDASGTTAPAPLFYVSPNEVGFEVPPGTATGLAKVTVTTNGVSQSASNIQIATVAPGLYTLNNVGLAAAYAIRVTASATQIVEPVYSMTTAGVITAAPINMGSATDQVYLVLYGTGLQAAGTAGVSVTVGGVNAPVVFAGPTGIIAGLDQVNVLLPASLAGKGNVNLQLTAAGVSANPLQITIQ
jgi:uncharacterized protein (TIGR03437 family)